MRIIVVINTPGTHLCKRGDCIRIEKDTDSFEISIQKVERILLTTSASLTTDVVELAVENDVDMVFLKKNGFPFGRVWTTKPGSIATIRRKQLKLQEHPLGLAFVKEWIMEKLNHQAKHLIKLGSTRKEEQKTELATAVDRIQRMTSKISALSRNQMEDTRATLQGYEGLAGRVYFSSLAKLLPPKYYFDGRSSRPSEDPFNCMLNYGYGVLYSNVEKA